MDNDQPVDQVIHKQATVGDIIQRYIHGKNAYDIAEEFGLDSEKVKEIILSANAAGKFRPEGQADELDIPEAPAAPVAPAVEVAPVAPVVEAPAPVAEAPAPVVEVAQPAVAPGDIAAQATVQAPGPMTTETDV